MNKVITDIGAAASPGIRVSASIRLLADGFSWQRYATKVIHFVSKTEFATTWGNNRQNMEAGLEKWRNDICRFIEHRAPQLGMEVERIFINFIEDPGADSSLSMRIWTERDAIFVWSCWAYLKGPVPSPVVQQGILPAFGFWPGDKMLQGTVADIFNVNSLLDMELGKTKIEPV